MSNELLGAKFSLSTQNLALDGSAIKQGYTLGPIEVDAATALATLKALGRLPVMDLLDFDVKVYVAGPQGKVSVQNISGKLCVAFVPEALNPVEERTPEETLAMVHSIEGSAPTAATEPGASREAEIMSMEASRRRGWRAVFDSYVVLAVLLAVGAAMAYLSFSERTPDGLEMVRDTAKIAAFNAQLNGRYGSPSATVLVLENGKLTGLEPKGTTGDQEVRFTFTYRFAMRADHVVILLSNGALLEVQPKDSVSFLASNYPLLDK